MGPVKGLNISQTICQYTVYPLWALTQACIFTCMHRWYECYNVIICQNVFENAFTMSTNPLHAFSSKSFRMLQFYFLTEYLYPVQRMFFSNNFLDGVILSIICYTLYFWMTLYFCDELELDKVDFRLHLNRK